MARPKSASNMTPAELKQRRAELAVLLKATAASRKEAEKAIKTTNATAKSAVAEATKKAEAVKKEADKAIAAANKAAEAANKRHGKAIEAADKGIAKIQAQLDALTPATAE
jgi:16S rRNA U516 pseudouridylate synthase RsuA-like enzyme